MSEWVDAKTLQENLQSLGFILKSGQTWNGKGSWEMKGVLTRWQSEMSYGDLKERKRRLREEKWDRRRETAGDGATSRSVKAFQFRNNGNA